MPRLGWDSEPMMAQFYKGLKDKVKDKLIKENRPDNFADYVAMAVQIDNRLYKCCIEKQGSSSQNNNNHH